MKNQPNKATVKDGLPTAHNVLSDAYQRHGWLFQPDVLPSGACPHENIAMEAIQEYSDQQNAELRKRVKELEAAVVSELESILEQIQGVHSDYVEDVIKERISILKYGL